jgi:hypothetical protein
MLQYEIPYFLLAVPLFVACAYPAFLIDTFSGFLSAQFFLCLELASGAIVSESIATGAIVSF